MENHVPDKTAALEAARNSLRCSGLEPLEPIFNILIFPELSPFPTSSSQPRSLHSPHAAQRERINQKNSLKKKQIIYIPLCCTQVLAEQGKQFIWKSVTPKNVNSRKGSHTPSLNPKGIFQSKLQTWIYTGNIYRSQYCRHHSSPAEEVQGSQNKPKSSDFPALKSNNSCSRAAVSSAPVSLSPGLPDIVWQ